MQPAPVQEKEPLPEIAPESESVSETAVPVDESAQPPRQDVWKTAFIVLVGIILLSGVLIYSTSVKRTDPKTVLQPDANGQPVQPLNPATGIEEEKLASMPPDAAVVNSNTSVAPGTLPGGDNYDPWARGGAPPPGAPQVGPGGKLITVPNGGSQFMPPDCILQPSGIYLCPVPVNANAAVKPAPTPKATPQNANVQPSSPPGATPKSSPTPAAAKPPTRPKASPTPNKPPGQDN